MSQEVSNRGISGPIKGHFPQFFFKKTFYNRVVNIIKTVELQSLLNRYGEVAIYKSLIQGCFFMSQFLCSIQTGIGQLSRHVENMTAA